MYNPFKERVEYLRKEKFYKELSTLKGNILELGFGNGQSLSYYSPDCQVFALEKDRAKINKIHKKYTLADNIHIVNGKAEKLLFENNYFDAVVASLVLCSVDSLEKAIGEIERVLKPGGKVVLLEHTRCEKPIIGKLQDLFAVPYSRIFGNCHQNRNPLPILSKHHFNLIMVDQQTIIVSPLIFVVALKKKKV